MQPSTLGRWCPGAQKHFKLALALRRVALSGNTLLIVTFSSSFFCCFAATLRAHSTEINQTLPNVRK